jgi:hypothetical protein
LNPGLPDDRALYWADRSAHNLRILINDLEFNQLSPNLKQVQINEAHHLLQLSSHVGRNGKHERE